MQRTERQSIPAKRQLIGALTALLVVAPGVVPLGLASTNGSDDDFVSTWTARLTDDDWMQAYLAKGVPLREPFNALPEREQRLHIPPLVDAVVAANKTWALLVEPPEATEKDRARVRAEAEQMVLDIITEPASLSGRGEATPPAPPDALHAKRMTTAEAAATETTRLRTVDVSGLAVGDSTGPDAIPTEPVDAADLPQSTVEKAFDHTIPSEPATTPAVIPARPQPFDVVPEEPELALDMFGPDDAAPDPFAGLAPVAPPEPPTGGGPWSAELGFTPLVAPPADGASIIVCWLAFSGVPPTCEERPTGVPALVSVDGDVTPDVSLELTPYATPGAPIAGGIGWSVTRLHAGDVPALVFAFVPLPEAVAQQLTPGRVAVVAVDGRASTLPGHATFGLGVSLLGGGHVGIHVDATTVNPGGAAAFVAGLIDETIDGTTAYHDEPIAATLALTAPPPSFTVDFMHDVGEGLLTNGSVATGDLYTLDVATTNPTGVAAVVVIEAETENATWRQVRTVDIDTLSGSIGVDVDVFESETHIIYAADASLTLAYAAYETPDTDEPATFEVQTQLEATSAPLFMNASTGAGSLLYEASDILPVVTWTRASAQNGAFTDRTSVTAIEVPQQVIADVQPETVFIEASDPIGELRFNIQDGQVTTSHPAPGDHFVRLLDTTGAAVHTLTQGQVAGLTFVDVAFAADALVLGAGLTGGQPFIGLVAERHPEIETFTRADIAAVPPDFVFTRSGLDFTFDAAIGVPLATVSWSETTPTNDSLIQVEATAVPASWSLALDLDDSMLDWQSATALERVLVKARSASPTAETNFTVRVTDVPTFVHAEWPVEAGRAALNTNGVTGRAEIQVATVSPEATRFLRVDAHEVPSDVYVNWTDQPAVEVNVSAPVGNVTAVFSDHWGYRAIAGEAVTHASFAGRLSTHVYIEQLQSTAVALAPGAALVESKHARPFAVDVQTDTTHAHINVSEVPNRINVTYGNASYTYEADATIANARVWVDRAASRLFVSVASVALFGSADFGGGNVDVAFAAPFSETSFIYQEGGLAHRAPVDEGVVVVEHGGQVALAGRVSGVQAFAMDATASDIRLVSDHPKPFFVVLDLESLYVRAQVSSIPNLVEIQRGNGAIPPAHPPPGVAPPLVPCGECGWVRWTADAAVVDVDLVIRRPSASEPAGDDSTWSTAIIDVLSLPTFAFVAWQTGQIHYETSVTIPEFYVRTWNPDWYLEVTAIALPRDGVIRWSIADDAGVVNYDAAGRMEQLTVFVSPDPARQKAVCAILEDVPRGLDVTWEKQNAAAIVARDPSNARVGRLRVQYTTDAVFSQLAGDHVLVFSKSDKAGNMTRASLLLSGVTEVAYRKWGGDGWNFTLDGQAGADVEVLVQTQEAKESFDDVVLVAGRVSPLADFLTIQGEGNEVIGAVEGTMAVNLSISRGRSDLLVGPGALDKPPIYLNGVSVRTTDEGGGFRARAVLDSLPGYFRIVPPESFRMDRWLRPASFTSLLVDVATETREVRATVDDPARDTQLLIQDDNPVVDFAFHNTANQATGAVAVTVRTFDADGPGWRVTNIEAPELPASLSVLVNTITPSHFTVTVSPGSVVTQATFQRDYEATLGVDLAVTVEDLPASPTTLLYHKETTGLAAPDDDPTTPMSCPGPSGRPIEYTKSTHIELDGEGLAATDVTLSLGPHLWKQGTTSFWGTVTDLDAPLLVKMVKHSAGSGKVVLELGSRGNVGNFALHAPFFKDLCVTESDRLQHGEDFSGVFYHMRAGKDLRGTMALPLEVSATDFHHAHLTFQSPIVTIHGAAAGDIRASLAGSTMEGIMSVHATVKPLFVIPWFTAKATNIDPPFDFGVYSFTPGWQDINNHGILGHPTWAKPRLHDHRVNELVLVGGAGQEVAEKWVCLVPMADQLKDVDEERACRALLKKDHNGKLQSLEFPTH